MSDRRARSLPAIRDSSPPPLPRTIQFLNTQISLPCQEPFLDAVEMQLNPRKKSSEPTCRQKEECIGESLEYAPLRFSHKGTPGLFRTIQPRCWNNPCTNGSLKAQDFVRQRTGPLCLASGPETELFLALRFWTRRRGLGGLAWEDQAIEVPHCVGDQDRSSYRKR